MKTAYGKLLSLAILLAVGVLMLAPMRSGIEDTLRASTELLDLDPGEIVEVRYDLRTETAQTVAYYSDDTAVAIVDQRGYIMAVSPGETKIRLVAQGGAFDEVKVRVSGVPITLFELNAESIKMEKGDVSGLSYRVNTGASMHNVKWESLDPSIASVDAAGRVSAVGGGDTYIVATAPNGMTDAALVSVHVQGNAVQIAPGDMRVGVGTTFPLQTRYLPVDTTDVPVSWTSSAPEVLTVDGSGVMQAVSVGTATVTVLTRDGLQGSMTITVDPASTDFQLSPNTVTIERGDSHTLSACFIGADGQVDQTVNHHVEWESTDPRIVSVENGVVTGHASGVAVITAYADGFKATSTVHVETSVQEVHLNISEQYLLKEQTGEPFQIRTSYVPADADEQKLVFTSDNPLVATVSEKGLVTMTGGYGTAIITVTAENGAQATCAVHVVTQLPASAAAEN